MRYDFATLDVFTDKRFAGNPLAVVFDADGLDTQRMQAIAREFNHPETVFVQKPSAPTSAASIRIFTPATELPFAGHPTVGTAVIIALKAGGDSTREIVVEEKIGPVRCTIVPGGKDRGHARFELPVLPKEAGTPADNNAIAAALGLAPGDIGFDGFSPARWSAGVAFTFVPVNGLDAIRRCRVDLGKWDAAFEAGSRSSAFVFCREAVEAASTFHARMFAPRLGIPEDPATGAAAAAFAGFYARATTLIDGEHRIVIEQGYEMGRPSHIELMLTIRGRNLASAAVGGNAIMITEGTIDI